MKEMVGGCCVCSDERGWPDNPLVYCDGNLCTVAVHQACYGIVTVPTGPWFCRKCEGLDTKIIKVKCELCPSKSGALKRTDTGGWAHVVCALYIPEVRFGNVTSMEPIVLRLIPSERYNKTCYICHDGGKSHRATAGACMQCNKSGCKQQFHVTCAQSLGLLCEEAGNYLDNVKYCGYCQHHYSKLKKGGNVKTIPPYKPVSNDDSQSSDSEGEKEGETSPRASGSGTPTNGGKSKAPARKSSHSGNVSSGKNTPTSAKTPTNNAQPIGGKPHSSDKKKTSPARRGSSVDAGSKGSTPAPSPQHTTEAAGGSTPSNSAKVTPPAVSPSAKSAEAVGVISTVSVVPIPVTTVTTVTADNVESPNRKSPPAVKSPTSVAPPARTYQESVITNTDAVDTKLTKKRRAMTSTSALHIRGFSPRPEIPEYNSMWSLTSMGDLNVDGVGNRMYKRMKLLEAHAMRHSSESPGYSPSRTQSPVRSQSPVAGPSGLNTAGGRKSPIHTQNGAGRSSAWGNLNVGYEMQQPGVSGVGNRDISLSNIPLPPMPPGPPGMKKKRAAMAVATSVATTMAGMPAPTNPSPSMIQAPSTQSLANVRRQPQSTPPLIYQETIKDSPPSSPGSERGAKAKKSAGNYSAPHMLGNELNPKSMSAARLQEQLSAELAAHAAGGVGPDPLLPPPLINKAAPTMSCSSGRSSSGAQSLDQLLERQWEQGSQFLMEQAQHFDIASLLSCLHQLRTENVRLEDHVGSLLQRRDHLLAVNARLAIPLTAAISSGPAESVRCPRENGPQVHGPQVHGPQVRGPAVPMRPGEPMPPERSQQLMMREVQQKPS